MKYSHTLKNWFLLLFLLGMILLGLFGYGKYSYGFSGRKITAPNSAILVFAIPMLFPYILMVFVNLFQNSKSEEKRNEQLGAQVKNLLQNGICMEIVFKEAISNLCETTVGKNSDIEILKNELLFFYVDLSESRDEVITIVTLKYFVKNKIYLKEVIFPFTKENTEICLNFQKSTKMYYDINDPQNAIIDLKFLE